MLGDADLRAKKLDMRKAILADLLHGCGEPVRYCDHVIGVGKEFFEIVRDAGLEGVVAKRRSSAYAGVLDDDWLKIKCLRVHDFVVGGWISDADKKIGALLLGEFIDGNLRYVGQVGSPSGWRVMRAVTRLLSSYLLYLAKLVETSGARIPQGTENGSENTVAGYLSGVCRRSITFSPVHSSFVCTSQASTEWSP
jgi:hypothetical protein